MRGLVLVLLAASGCARRATTDAEAQASAVVGALDTAWARRGSDGLEPVEAAFAAIGSPQDTIPGVLWRRARLQVAEGELVDDPAEARRAYARARGTAMACLQQDHAVAQLVAEGRAAAPPEAAPEPGAPPPVVTVPPERRPCAAWAGYAWARWLAQEPGPGTALDVPRVEQLLELGHDPADAERERTIAWGRALVALVAPDHGSRADVLAAAAPEGEGAWVRYEDLRRLAPELLAARPSTPPATPEDRAAARRVGG
jgi:hypothetical protein